MCFFAWEATKGKIPRKFTLKRRNFNSPSRPFMFLEEKESMDHIQGFWGHEVFVFSLLYMATPPWCLLMLFLITYQKENEKNLWIISLCIVGGFFHCGISLSLSLMGLVGFNLLIWGLIVARRRRRKKSWILGVWNMLPLAIWCSTWKERNRHNFEDKVLSFQDYKLYFLRFLYSWSVGLYDCLLYTSDAADE